MIHLEIDQAVELLNAGEIIAYPAEGVYGLGVDATNREAVLALLTLKRREEKKGFIILVDIFERIKDWIKPLSKKEEELMFSFHHEGYRVTWLIEKASLCPSYLTGEHRTLAVRVTNHIALKELCEKFAKPIVSTSANISSLPTLLDESSIESIFGTSVQGLLKGDIGSLEHATQIIDLETMSVIRS